MTSNVQWNNQYEGNYSNAGDSNSNAWNRPLVNTPQTNPASWPQLGASNSETEQAPPGQPPPQEEGNWSAANNNTTSNSETSTNSAWGRVPENASKPKQSATGWGTPSSGPAWGQTTTVDNGTAVWGKSSSQQPQPGWGGQPQPAQTNEQSAPTSGWGAPNTTAAANGTESAAPPPSSSTSSSTTSSSQPVSWAKAASAGLPTTSSSGESDSAPTESEQQEATENNPTISSNTSTSSENDPFQKIVNSHEGWGKKPIQQGTSWKIADTGPAYNRPQVSNGTEAWGKHSGSQPAGSGWGDNANSKPSAGGGWGGTASPSYQPAASGQAWGAQSQQPQQPQQRQQPNTRPFMSGNGPNTPGWGEQPQNPNGTGRWNEMANQGAGGNWTGAPPVPQQQTGPGWGASQSGGANASAGWGPGQQQGPGGQNAGWSGNMVQQSPTIDPTTWTRPTEAGVDNGTAAWGDPGTYSKVSMWDKTGKANANNEPAAGQMPAANNQIKTTGWGAPNQQTNRPPSPKGWGDVSPTRTNPADKGTGAWGQKPGDKWDKGGNGGNNWNPMKPTGGGGGWGQPSDSQWGADNGPTWGQNDGGMKGNMDFGPRGMMPNPLNMPQQQMMLRNQTPPQPNVPPQPQFQHQFQQIRHAVMNGIVPAQVLNPQLMTPQHMQNVMQLIAKATEIQKIQAKLNTLMNQNKPMAIPAMVRQQQMEQCARALRQHQQQLEILRSVIIQSMLQKAQPNPANKMNNPMNAGGMDMGRMRSGSTNQPMVSPLNNMNPMMQALPSPGMSSITSPTGREESRFASNWKQPNNFGSMGDNLMQPNPSQMGMGMGPGGDSAFNGSAFRPQTDENNFNEVRGAADNSSGLPTKDANQAAVDASAALADIGPPEFTPGVPWKGFRNIDPEADPNITPGSVAISKTMSLNTVNADQVLNRDRSAAQPDSAPSNATNMNTTMPNNELNIPNQIWSTAGTEGNNWSAPNQDTRGSWLVLTNFNQQVDPAYVQSLCAQHGSVTSFQPHYPMEGTALVKYHSPDEALKAKNALNMCMVGSTMLVATVATDQDVSNFMTARAGGSWSSNLSSRFSASNAYPNRDTTAPPSSVPPQPYWGGNPSTNMTPGTSWAGNASYNLSWSRSTGEEQGRVTSPMHSLLPENLLGGETM